MSELIRNNQEKINNNINQLDNMPEHDGDAARKNVEKEIERLNKLAVEAGTSGDPALEAALKEEATNLAKSGNADQGNQDDNYDGGRVDNVDKAWEMAKAGNSYRTQAAEDRKWAKELEGQGKNENNMVEYLRYSAEEEDRIAREAEENAGKKYDEEH